MMRKLSRNHKFLIVLASALLFWVLLLTVIIASCSKGEEKPRNEGAALIPIARGQMFNNIDCNYAIVYDPDTGVMYYASRNYLSPLYAADGQLRRLRHIR